jgi:hypothetical protein
VFVTNMSETVEDLVLAEGCFFRLMAWQEIHIRGYPYCRPPGSLLHDGSRVLLASPSRKTSRSECKAISYACRTDGY